jgi:hypothetical protein
MPTSRREFLAAPMLAALFAKGGQAAVDPAMTIVRQAGDIAWEVALDRPPKTVEYAYLMGKPSEPGPYLSLVRWYPGFMSVPHWYETDRWCMVVSGTWWVASGERFDPAGCVPVPAGGYVHRVARTPHYDGVVRGAPEPSVIAIFGIGPITFHKSDPNGPSWREV